MESENKEHTKGGQTSQEESESYAIDQSLKSMDVCNYVGNAY